MPGTLHDETLDEVAAGGRPALARPEPYLIVSIEADRPRSGSSRHGLRGIDEVTLGRGDERRATRDGRSLTLALPSPWMSGVHARIRRAGQQWRVEDAGSKNGTLVNGTSVAHAALRDGDLVEVGRTLILFREALHGPPSTPLDVDSRGLQVHAHGLGTLIPALADGFDALARIARSDVAVLLRGETGTGKEVTARALHIVSGRPGPFVAVNCGGLPANLVESQLFGHTKGAFSGAVRDEPGFVRASAGGTLFLDEIADLPAASQAALLRVLQDGEVTPVGATRAVRVELRVVSATNQDLEENLSGGKFRPDLFARLDGFTHVLAPLRERREDVGLLVADILAEVAPDADRIKLAPEAGRALLTYGWPLNVRELRQCLARACALAKGTSAVELAHLPPAVAGALAPKTAAPAESGSAADDSSRLRSQLEALLAEHEGNVAEVARVMGKARMQVQRWMKRFAIDPNRYRR